MPVKLSFTKDMLDQMIDRKLSEPPPQAMTPESGREVLLDKLRTVAKKKPRLV